MTFARRSLRARCVPATTSRPRPTSPRGGIPRAGPIRNALAALRGEGLIETSRGRPASRRRPQSQPAPSTCRCRSLRWARELGVTPGAQTQELSLRRAGELGAALGVDASDTIVSVVRLAPARRQAHHVGAPQLHGGRRTPAVRGEPRRGLQSRSTCHRSGIPNRHPAARDRLPWPPTIRMPRCCGCPGGTPILRLTRTSRDAEGRIFEASEDRYLSEVVRFTVAASGISTDGHYMRAVGG